MIEFGAAVKDENDLLPCPQAELIVESFVPTFPD
jgi:hypothetical protein